MLIEMFFLLVKLIGLVLILIGVLLIYDARLITKKFFGFGDQNDATQRFKDIWIYNSYCWGINSVFCIEIA